MERARIYSAIELKGGPGYVLKIALSFLKFELIIKELKEKEKSLLKTKNRYYFIGKLNHQNHHLFS